MHILTHPARHDTHTLIAVTIHYAKLLSLCQALCCALYKHCISAHEHGVLFLIWANRPESKWIPQGYTAGKALPLALPLALPSPL